MSASYDEQYELDDCELSHIHAKIHLLLAEEMYQLLNANHTRGICHESHPPVRRVEGVDPHERDCAHFEHKPAGEIAMNGVGAVVGESLLRRALPCHRDCDFALLLHNLAILRA